MKDRRRVIDFLGIGAQKAGTGWVFVQLYHHEQVFLPAVKEVHFWDMHYDRGLDWYRDIFKDANGRIAGEITPAYAILDPARIREVHKLNPDLRILYTLRNPIDRAWSQAIMRASFAGQDPRDLTDEWFIEAFNQKGALLRGDYETCLRTWREVFAGDQIAVMWFEEIISRPRDFLRACCRHIGVDESLAERQPDRLLRMTVNAGPGYPIRPQLRAYLLNVYADKIRSLQDYLGKDLGPWLEA